MQQNIQEWANNNFIGIKFDDIRRGKRLVKIATKMAENPGKSIPQLFSKFYDVKATYNFFKHPEATPDQVQKQHRKVVLNELYKDGEFLLIEDTCTMSFCGREKIAGLNPIGKSNEPGGAQGFLLHSVLAVKWQGAADELQELNRRPVDVLGLAHQQYKLRVPSLKRDSVRLNRRNLSESKINELESALWSNSTSNLSVLNNAKQRYVRVCDRGADIFDVLFNTKKRGLGFLIRASANRVLPNKKKLFDFARELESLGSFTLKLRSRKDKIARTVIFDISAGNVTITQPQRSGFSRNNRPSMSCTVVRVYESNPAPGNDPIEWVLFSDLEISTFEQAVKCALQYATRWLIEEFHKALKTGLGAEKLQLEGGSRLFSAIAIMSIVALRLIDIRERFRSIALEPASESGLTKLELKILSVSLDRILKNVTDVNLALGSLGGHLNRKSDGLPGFLSLWRGTTKLQNLVEGYRIAEKIRRT